MKRGRSTRQLDTAARRLLAGMVTSCAAQAGAQDMNSGLAKCVAVAPNPQFRPRCAVTRLNLDKLAAARLDGSDVHIRCGLNKPASGIRGFERPKAGLPATPAQL